MQTARNYLAGWEKTTLDPQNYGKGFSAIYQAAANGTQITGADSTFARLLDPDARAMAVIAGTRMGESMAKELNLNEQDTAKLNQDIRSLPTEEKDGYFTQ